MIFPTEKLQIRQATRTDYLQINNFLHTETYIHRHLDWRAPIEWLGSQPFLVGEENGELAAILACPTDPAEIAWIRLYTAVPHLLVSAWNQLFETAVQQFEANSGIVIAGIALNDWMEELLQQSNFICAQRIIVLEWNSQIPQAFSPPKGVRIRPMTLEDIRVVEKTDNAAFAPLWCNSADALALAFQQGEYSTVAVDTEGQIIGYQISTAFPMAAHLARLAVSPDRQHQQIGHFLVHDLLLYAQEKRIWRVTVNTQSDNQASLGLYKKLGFQRTYEEFPVYRYVV